MSNSQPWHWDKLDTSAPLPMTHYLNTFGWKMIVDLLQTTSRLWSQLISAWIYVLRDFFWDLHSFSVESGSPELHVNVFFKSILSFFENLQDSLSSTFWASRLRWPMKHNTLGKWRSTYLRKITTTLPKERCDMSMGKQTLLRRTITCRRQAAPGFSLLSHAWQEICESPCLRDFGETRSPEKQSDHWIYNSSPQAMSSHRCSSFETSAPGCAGNYWYYLSIFGVLVPLKKLFWPFWMLIKWFIDLHNGKSDHNYPYSSILFTNNDVIININWPWPDWHNICIHTENAESTVLPHSEATLESTSAVWDAQPTLGQWSRWRRPRAQQTPAEQSSPCGWVGRLQDSLWLLMTLMAKKRWCSQVWKLWVWCSRLCLVSHWRREAFQLKFCKDRPSGAPTSSANARACPNKSLPLLAFCWKSKNMPRLFMICLPIQREAIPNEAHLGRDRAWLGCWEFQHLFWNAELRTFHQLAPLACLIVIIMTEQIGMEPRGISGRKTVIPKNPNLSEPTLPHLGILRPCNQSHPNKGQACL